MPKALTYGVYNLSRVYLQKDRGYLDDKVTQYYHNGVLASAGQKCQCACAEQWEVADIRYIQHSEHELFQYVESGFVQL
jgi:hypothetical protein